MESPTEARVQSGRSVLSSREACQPIQFVPVKLASSSFLARVAVRREFSVSDDVYRRGKDPPKKTGNKNEPSGNKQETAHFRKRGNISEEVHSHL